MRIGTGVWPLFGAPLLGTLAMLAATVPAQCDTLWESAIDIAGINGQVHDSVMWDPDGAGPLTSVWVIAGDFTAAGNVLARHIATYDPVTAQWGTLGAGLDRQADAVVVMPNNDLIVGGRFTTAGNVAATKVARWNGTNWSAMGAGFAAFHNVSELAIEATGTLIAAASPGGLFFGSELARWNGTSWVFPGLTCNGVVNAIRPMPNGDLIVGGNFTTSGSVATSGIARWNGTAWMPFGSGVGTVLGLPGSVRTLTLLANGDLVIGGFFFDVGGVPMSNLARWNGSAWSPVAGSQTDFVSMVQTMANGDLLVGALRVDGGGPLIPGFARFDGSSWSAVGTGTQGSATTVAVTANGDWLVSGLATAGTNRVRDVARWNGASWQPLELGIGGPVEEMTTMQNGDLVIAGTFSDVVGVAANRVARFDGSTWSPLGAGIDGRINAVVPLQNGDLVAGGAFDHAGGQPIRALARWDGTTWSQLGSGLPSTPYPASVFALTVLPDGDLIVAGAFASAGGVTGRSLARWDGSSWHAMGTQGTHSGIYSLASSPTGELYAGGVFSINGQSHIGTAQWNGTSWMPVGAAFSRAPAALAIAHNGDLWAGGDFATIGGAPIQGIARWNGTAWVTVGNGMSLLQNERVAAIEVLPDGDVLIVGNFLDAGGIRVNHAARWDGISWAPVDSGLNGPATAMTRLPNGELTIGGHFDIAGSVPSGYLATLTTPCPASVTVGPGGCSGSAGANTLTALDLPWTGATLHARVDGLTSPALALGVFGLSTTSTPLSALAPQGVPGCTLTVSPDIALFYLPLTGSFITEVAIPDTAALAGVVGYQQVLAAELDAQGNITAITSTNRLAATLGTF